MTDFKEGDEVLVKATVKNVYDNGFFLLQFHGQERPLVYDDPYVKNLVKNAENTLTVEKPEMFPAPAALDVNKQLLEALKKLRAAFAFSMKIRGKSDEMLETVLSPADEAIAAAEKGA
jgi:hypothetical protein